MPTYDFLHVLRSRGNKVYVVAIDVGSFEPVVRLAWYPTGVLRQDAHDVLGSGFEGMKLKQSGNGVYTVPSVPGILVTLTGGGRTEADFVERAEIPEPKHRLKGKGSATRVKWEMGEWRILGKRGDALLARVDLEDYATYDDTRSIHYFPTR
jgi:hypothetical protein